MSKIWSELNKVATKRWGEMSEEEKRPYVEKYETDIENWKGEKAQMKAQLEAMGEEGKRGEGKKASIFWPPPVLF